MKTISLSTCDGNSFHWKASGLSFHDTFGEAIETVKRFYGVGDEFEGDTDFYISSIVRERLTNFINSHTQYPPIKGIVIFNHEEIIEYDLFL